VRTAWSFAVGRIRIIVEAIIAMAKNPRAAFEKRQKELKRQKKQQEKSAKQLARREEKARNVADEKIVEDPDLAGIVLGPNPPPPEAT